MIAAVNRVTKWTNMWAVFSTVVAFLLTGLVGNRLLVQWQYWTWTKQQGLLGKEKEYFAFRDLTSELSRLMGKRLYRMKRLLSGVISNRDDLTERALASYDEVLSEWNESFNELAARLTILGSFYFTRELEMRVQQPFQQIGTVLEGLIRQHRANAPLSSSLIQHCRQGLNELQIAVAEFDRDLIRTLDEKRIATYFPKVIAFNRWSLEEFSTFELIKALTVPDVDRHSVSRAP